MKRDELRITISAVADPTSAPEATIIASFNPKYRQTPRYTPTAKNAISCAATTIGSVLRSELKFLRKSSPSNRSR